jgi:CDP-2,3-bis-(O-geranylgeranyl)-sn-glycerol synthase
MDILLVVGKALWLFLPACVANVIPAFTTRINVLAIPVSKRWLGENKTWRGVVVGCIGAIACAYAQRWAIDHLEVFDPLTLIDYRAVRPFLLGLLMGAGALGGDMVESLLKRQLGKPPGSRWWPWDDVDFLLGASLCAFPYLGLGIECSVVLFVGIGVCAVLHDPICWIVYQCGLKSRPY